VNKGLEIIEAHHLFGLGLDSIDAVIHPQSLVHSLAEFADGSVLAQISYPDMRLPIQYALTAPEHAPREVSMMDLIGVGSLSFEAIDHERFPGLRLCQDAGNRGGSASAVLCAADDVAVSAFLGEQIGFTDITAVIAETLERHTGTRLSTLDDVLAVTEWAERTAQEVVGALSRS
jgi:1-deoxy-D-xylulose-5-phosphate reductoisomerase